VSPASIDLCGVLVVPVKDDFSRIHGDVIERIFEEVSLPPDLFSLALDRFQMEFKS
jgi:hypothetical protein